MKNKKQENNRPLSDEEIEEIINQKYSNKLPHTKDYIREQLKKDPSYKCKFSMVKEDFIEEGNKIHQEKINYKYVPDIIKNNRQKIKLICEEINPKTKEIFGEFIINSEKFLHRNQSHPGYGLVKLAKNRVSKAADNLQKLLDLKFPWISFNKEDYVSKKTPLKFHCKYHGNFIALPNNISVSHWGCCLGCYKDSYIPTINEFIERYKSNYINKYGEECPYLFNNIREIKSIKDEVTLYCPIHDKYFSNTVENFLLYGIKCKDCSFENVQKSRALTTKIFIKRSKELFGDNFFGYEKTKYYNLHTPVIITCPIHGDVLVAPVSHLNGNGGCPKCKGSNGELMIIDVLDQLKKYNNDLSYIYQFDITNETYFSFNRFNTVTVDFFIKYHNHNFILETNGDQHYKEIIHFGGKERFEKQLIRDNAIKQYCTDNNIILIEVPILGTFKVNKRLLKIKDSVAYIFNNNIFDQELINNIFKEFLTTVEKGGKNE